MKRLKIPIRKILSFADVYIFHLGFCSFREAIYYRVPVIGIPFIYDGFAVALSVIKNNIGIILDNANLTANQLKNSVNKIFNTNIYRDNLNRCYEKASELGGEEKMASYIIQQYGLN